MVLAAVVVLELAQWVSAHRPLRQRGRSARRAPLHRHEIPIVTSGNRPNRDSVLWKWWVTTEFRASCRHNYGDLSILDPLSAMIVSLGLLW